MTEQVKKPDSVMDYRSLCKYCDVTALHSSLSSWHFYHSAICYIVSTLTADPTWCTPRCIGGLCGAIGADCYDVTYTPNHNVVEEVLSPVCHCDRCGQCLAYSITFSESLCGGYWDMKPCKEYFYCYVTNFCMSLYRALCLGSHCFNEGCCMSILLWVLKSRIKV